MFFIAHMLKVQIKCTNKKHKIETRDDEPSYIDVSMVLRNNLDGHDMPNYKYMQWTKYMMFLNYNLTIPP